MTDTIYRCPSCKARAELSDTVCAICGDVLSPNTLLRTYSAVKQLTRPVSGGAPGPAASGILGVTPSTSSQRVKPGGPGIAPSSTSDATADVATLRKFMSPQTSVSQVPVTKPSTAKLPAPIAPLPPEPTQVAAPRLVAPRLIAPRLIAPRSQSNPRAISGYTMGLMLGCAVLVLGVALFVGINLAREATPEVRAIAVDTPLVATPVPEIKIVFSRAGTTSPLEGTVIAQGTDVAASLAAMQADATANAQTAEMSSITTLASVPTIVPTATTMAIALPPGKWHLELASARYENSGRPTQNCGRLKADDMVRKFTFTLQVTNNTGADLDAKGWGAVAYTGETPAAQLCYFKTEGPSVPTLLQGQTRQVTLSAFIELEQRVSKIVVGDNVGNATRICLKDTQVIDCE